MADTFLTDTGVFVRWYIEQDGFEDAQRYLSGHLDGTVELQTVDFVRFELADVLRKKAVLPKKMQLDEYVAAVRSLDDLDVTIHISSGDVLGSAAELAGSRIIRFFDALLVAWSIELGATILTSDKKLCNAAAGLARTELLVGVSP